MKDPVDKERLQQAITNIIPKRFPYFQVYLKESFFAYVLERTDDIPKLEEDSRYTNRYVDFHDENFLFLFRTDGTNIALEMSHIISDGYGTMVLLLSVTAEYLRLGGIEVEESPQVFRPDDPIDPEEWSCAYTELFNSKGPSMKPDKPAFIPAGDAINLEHYFTTRLHMDVEKVKIMARERKVTLVVFMSGIYVWAIQELYLAELKKGNVKPGRPLRFQIPVNLRRDYPTKSLKNFSYIYSPVFTISRPEEKRDVEDLIKLIADEIRHERHGQVVENQLRRNVRLTTNPLYKYMPRVIKERLLAWFYQLFARGLYSGVLTSLGDVKLPAEIEEQVASLDILACNSPAPGRNSTMFSYKGLLEMNIGSTVDNMDLEDLIVGKIKEMGLNVDMIQKREPESEN